MARLRRDERVELVGGLGPYLLSLIHRLRQAQWGLSLRGVVVAVAINLALHRGEPGGGGRRANPLKTRVKARPSALALPSLNLLSFRAGRWLRGRADVWMRGSIFA